MSKLERDSAGDIFDTNSKRVKRLVDQEQQQQGGPARRAIMIGGSQSGTNTITPCAACKLLRRRCAQECPFSPYFSPQEPQKFASVHKIFGASNVSKMLLEVPESQRADTANSLVYEANARLRDPVYGCMGAISALQQQAQSLQAELATVRSEIMRYRYRENTVAAAAATANASGVLVSGFPTAAQERALPVALATAQSSRGNTVGTAPDTKDRYW
ncbi:hypothetical protein O6H91_17G059100 [Diphasiastrum complanatum]|uniref:Uncharacterized protein n=1 Tax=Diphasiastrum complanatum TaxID=34168 RepID=A0ACC2B786_DIPCM|nr:hypothetical protein O6H91_17G059100 [Diphasiastrum complanatum]